MIQPDDPRLTSYALGAMDHDERAAFEALLLDDPTAQAEVDAIRSFGADLGAAFAAEPEARLSEVQRAQVVRSATPPSVAAAVARWWSSPLMEVAAMFLVAGGLLVGAVTKFKDALNNAYDGRAEAIDPRILAKLDQGSSYAPPQDGRSLPEHADELELTRASRDQGLRTWGPITPDERARLIKELQEARLLLFGRENDEIRYDHFRTTILDPASTRIPEILALEDWKSVTDDQLRALWVRLNAATGPGVPDAHGGLVGSLDRASDRSEYALLHDHAFVSTDTDRLSTFAIDVDTAAYARIRRHLRQQSTLPPPELVRIEELLNAFTYDLAPPTGEHPFAAHIEAATCPWAPSRRLVRVTLKGRELQADRRPPTNLVFLIDVSGSMADADKLPLVKRSLALLAAQLRPEDRVSIVVYAGASGLVLDGASGERPADVLFALDRLQAGGSTNGGAGIQLAYDVASRHFLEGGVNRVVLCTDGDWNVGLQSREQLDALIGEKAVGNVFLSVLGFGMGSYRDDTLERLADRGNGHYAFIDTLAEARKVLVEQLQGTLVTIARDVKVQVEWSPTRVRSWRLIGYENRVLAARDFADDTKDAGELGASHAVTALYEVEPADGATGPLLTLRLRYKPPEGQTSQLLEQTFGDEGGAFEQASVDFRFASAVAAFGLVLRESPHKGTSTLALVEQLAQGSLGRDPHGQRTELLELVRHARRVTGK